jgi:hypothetical protein
MRKLLFYAAAAASLFLFAGCPFDCSSDEYPNIVGPEDSQAPPDRPADTR